VLGTPEDRLWNSYGGPFDSLLALSVDDGRDLSGSTETGSTWALPPIGGFQAAATTPSLGLLGRNTVEDGSYRYQSATPYLPSTCMT
jgi:hypothetical protein